MGDLINKEYKRLAKDCAKEGVLGGFKHQTILVTDSKGQGIRRVVPSLARFKIISKAGASAADCDLLDEVKKNIKGKKSPVVLVWFGTCELTSKKGKYINLRHPLIKMQKYASLSIGDFKVKILETNKKYENSIPRLSI